MRAVAVALVLACSSSGSPPERDLPSISVTFVLRDASGRAVAVDLDDARRALRARVIGGSIEATTTADGEPGIAIATTFDPDEGRRERGEAALRAAIGPIRDIFRSGDWLWIYPTGPIAERDVRAALDGVGLEVVRYSQGDSAIEVKLAGPDRAYERALEDALGRDAVVVDLITSPDR